MSYTDEGIRAYGPQDDEWVQDEDGWGPRLDNDDEWRRDEDDGMAADEPYPYSFDEWNAVRMNTGRNPVTFPDYVTGYLAEHSARMDVRSWDTLVYFGAVDELESNGEMTL